jgi:hypothetical protein
VVFLLFEAFVMKLPAIQFQNIIPFTGKTSVSKILLLPQLRVAYRLMLRKIGWSHPKLLFSCMKLKIFACQALRALSSASGLPFLTSCRFLFPGRNS